MIYVTAGCLRGWIWWWNPSTIQRHCSCTKKPMVFRSLSLETQWYHEFFVFLRIVEFDKVKISKGARNHCRFAGFCWCQQKWVRMTPPFSSNFHLQQFALMKPALTKASKNTRKNMKIKQSFSQQINLWAHPHPPPPPLSNPPSTSTSVTQGVVAAALLMTLGVCSDHIVLLCQRRVRFDTLEGKKINGKISSKIPPKMLQNALGHVIKSTKISWVSYCIKDEWRFTFAFFQKSYSTNLYFWSHEPNRNWLLLSAFPLQKEVHFSFFGCVRECRKLWVGFCISCSHQNLGKSQPQLQRFLIISGTIRRIPYCDDCHSWNANLGISRNPAEKFSIVYISCSEGISYIWVFPKIVVPQNGWFIRENPIKMGWFGGFSPDFWFNTHTHRCSTSRGPCLAYHMPVRNWKWLTAKRCGTVWPESLLPEPSEWTHVFDCFCSLLYLFFLMLTILIAWNIRVWINS